VVVTSVTLTTVVLTRQLLVQNSVATEFHRNPPSLFVDIRSRGRKDGRGFRLEHGIFLKY